jgi:hypothetical protein
MLYAVRTSLVVAALAATVPAPFSAAALAGPCDCCCRVCCQPRCVCATVPQTSYQPVVQQRDVLTTEYRTEPVTESVPSTIYENVLIDEGRYETVWVPRMTSKTVARTVYQNRISYRTVPYQVTRRVSEYGTQTAPYQATRYLPTTPSLAYSPIGAPVVSSAPYSYSSSGVAAYPALAAPSVASSSFAGSTGGPVPDPRFSSGSAPIMPRSAAGLNADGYTSSAADNRSVDRGPSLFTPAPSAAQVWRTPRGTVTR